MKWFPLVLAIILVGCGGSDGGTKSLANNKPPQATCSATVIWEPPTERTDGTPITTDEMEKFTIYVNKQNNVTDNTIVAVIDITDVNTTDFTIQELSRGQKYFYMTVTDTEGRVSTFSNILNKLC